jgi:hypothetical protein
MASVPSPLALLRYPVVLILEVDGARDLASLFLCERLHVVLKLLDQDVRVDHSLLLHFDDLVQISQLRVELGQCCPLFLQAALHLSVLPL